MNKSYKKSILISGGTGFIGYHLALKLVQKKFQVTSISTSFPKKNRYIKNVKYIICDISKKNELKKKITQNYDYVINLGGYIDHNNKKKTLTSHYYGAKNLAEIFKKKKFLRFIQLGSSVEYNGTASPHKEISKIQVKKLQSIYAEAKSKATIFLLKYAKNYNFPVVILRVYIAYGPNQGVNRLIPIVIKACLNKKSFPCSNGLQFRDFIYIDDLVDAIIKCLNKNNKINGEILNIGSGKPRQVKNLINTVVKKIRGGIPNFGLVQLRKDEVLKFYPDIRKARKLLKWKPKTSFNIGIKKTIKFYEKKK